MKVIPETMRSKISTGVVVAATSLCLTFAPVGAWAAEMEAPDCASCHGDAHKQGDENPHGYPTGAAEAAETEDAAETPSDEAAAEDEKAPEAEATTEGAEEATPEAEDASDEAAKPEETAGPTVSGKDAVDKIFKAYDTTRDDLAGIEAALKGVDISDEYSMQFQMVQPSQDTEMALLWSNGADLKQLRVQISDGSDGLVELDADITKDMLWFAIPGATPEPLVYDIKEMAPNYLELLGAISETDLPESRYLPLISGLLLNMASNPDLDAADHAKDEVKSIIKDSFAGLDAQEVKGTYEVNGSDVECEGYKFSFDNQFAGQMLENCKPAVMDFVNAYWNPEFDQMTPYSVSTIAKLAYGMLILQANEVPQTWEFSVYMHEGELAAMVLESEYTSYELQYNGGDYRSQNVTLLIDGQEVSKVEGVIEDGVQMVTSTSEVTDEYGYSEDVTTIFLCDLETGDFELVTSDGSLDVEGTMAILGDEVSFTAEVTSDDEDLDGMQLAYIKIEGAQDLPALADESSMTVEDVDAVDEGEVEADVDTADTVDAEGTDADDAATSALEAFKSRD